MSYAEKRFKAVCADPRCVDEGTVLRVYGGKLDWFCERHGGMIEATSPTK